MTKEFNSLDEIQKYYDEDTDSYIFKEGDELIDLVVFNFDFNVKANIDVFNLEAWNISANNINACDINAYNINAYNLNACDISAFNINALDIDALDIVANDINCNNIYAKDISVSNITAKGFINAKDISYWAICIAYSNIKCNSIKGRRENSKHLVLDGKLEIKEELEND